MISSDLKCIKLDTHQEPNRKRHKKDNEEDECSFAARMHHTLTRLATQVLIETDRLAWEYLWMNNFKFFVSLDLSAGVSFSASAGCDLALEITVK